MVQNSKFEVAILVQRLFFRVGARRCTASQNYAVSVEHLGSLIAFADGLGRRTSVRCGDWHAIDVFAQTNFEPAALLSDLAGSVRIPQNLTARTRRLAANASAAA